LCGRQGNEIVGSRVIEKGRADDAAVWEGKVKAVKLESQQARGRALPRQRVIEAAIGAVHFEGRRSQERGEISPGREQAMGGRVWMGEKGDLGGRLGGRIVGAENSFFKAVA
jgi:hypothetical protein